MELVAEGRRLRGRRRRLVIAVLALVVIAGFACSVMLGDRVYGPVEVWRVMIGEEVDGATFTVGSLRLPRATLAVATGLCFGLAGVTFQTMLRNPLASPDIIGISTGASAAAAIAIVMFGLGGAAVSGVAVVSGLVVAIVIYLLAFRRGGVGTRLILIGIGIAAMLESVIAYVLSQAGQWDLQEVTRWLTGSLNGVGWAQVASTAIALVVLGPLLLACTRSLSALQLGDDTAAALGVRVEVTRLFIVVAAVGLVAFATAAAGPIAFVAFLAGPIAARLVGPNGSLLVPAALVGAALVVIADFVGQHLLDTRFPVGVVTGVLGAPYLVYLIVRTNRAGGSL
ncbi:FecCD family ABC transporter permease [Pseudoclavibacter endophyticus]|uniref:FecCD family ABC transporter permease n=1 Tax=Pseudoclavibacter endophyticus TaxID=1778590 RepID=UPI001CE409C2|nr:iron chelate uptake ABC transporter family permease subunit [Pseudoclavibacter endophyticus]